MGKIFVFEYPDDCGARDAGLFTDRSFAEFFAVVVKLFHLGGEPC